MGALKSSCRRPRISSRRPRRTRPSTTRSAWRRRTLTSRRALWAAAELWQGVGKGWGSCGGQPSAAWHAPSARRSPRRCAARCSHRLTHAPAVSRAAALPQRGRRLLQPDQQLVWLRRGRRRRQRQVHCGECLHEAGWPGCGGPGRRRAPAWLPLTRSSHDTLPAFRLQDDIKLECEVRFLMPALNCVRRLLHPCLHAHAALASHRESGG